MSTICEYINSVRTLITQLNERALASHTALQKELVQPLAELSSLASEEEVGVGQSSGRILSLRRNAAAFMVGASRNAKATERHGDKMLRNVNDEIASKRAEVEAAMKAVAKLMANIVGGVGDVTQEDGGHEDNTKDETPTSLLNDKAFTEEYGGDEYKSVHHLRAVAFLSEDLLALTHSEYSELALPTFDGLSFEHLLDSSSGGFEPVRRHLEAVSDDAKAWALSSLAERKQEMDEEDFEESLSEVCDAFSGPVVAWVKGKWYAHNSKLSSRVWRVREVAVLCIQRVLKAIQVRLQATAKGEHDGGLTKLRADLLLALMRRRIFERSGPVRALLLSSGEIAHELNCCALPHCGDSAPILETTDELVKREAKSMQDVQAKILEQIEQMSA